MSFEIVTDSCCNLTEDTIDRLSVHILPLEFICEGEHFQSYLKGETTDLKQFYTMMRDGKVITTSLPNLADSEELMRGLLEEGKDVLYLAFSSGLSGTYQAIDTLCRQLAEQYPERTVLTVDTLAASGGQGLLVYHAAKHREAGEDIRAVCQWVEDNKLKLAHWFTVDDLMFLLRGGRVSKASAYAGTMLNIKPVMHVDDEGHLIPVSKVRGRKKSIQAMVKRMEETVSPAAAEQPIFITHGDCPEDVEYLEKLICEKFGDGIELHVNYVDPVIGAHSGPGTLALFFLADHR